MLSRSQRLFSAHMLLLVFGITSWSGVADSKSSLLLPYPPDIGHVPAVTFDSTGRAVGDSEFSLQALQNGRFLMRVSMSIKDGAENRIRAELETVATGENDSPRLRILTERSQSFDADGRAMRLLFIDHTSGIASCTPAGGTTEDAVTIALPEDDRVANVPLNLLFLPLARGEVERVHFQLFVCQDGPRIHDFIALRGGPPREFGDSSILEVRYGPDVGRVISWVASRILPRLSFWFDTNRDGTYVGHRMPLYSKGPDVLMIRKDVSPPAIGPPFEQPCDSGTSP